MNDVKQITKMSILISVGLLISCTINSVQSAKPAELAKPDGAFETQQVKTQTGERILHFPKDRSLGRLMIADENDSREITTFGGYPFEAINWWKEGYYGQAAGDVKIPEGKIVRLILYSSSWQNPQDLSALNQLHPDDIYTLTLSPKWSVGGQSPDDRCMPYVAHLTGLKTLEIEGADITTKGLEYLTALKSLERLNLPDNLNDSGMLVVGKLKTLVELCIGENNTVTDIGLKPLANLKYLKLLNIFSYRMTGEGLNVLSELPSINYLILRGDFSNDAPLYLKNALSLRTLKIDTNKFDDSGMKNVAALTQLENFDAYWMREITDEGIAYFKNLPNLKKLQILSSKVTDDGLLCLQACPNIDYLALPRGISDTGLTNLSRFSRLKYLGASNGSYSDKGIAELTKCKLLEHLIINSSGLTDESLRYVSQLKKLESLFIKGEVISDEGIKYIAKLTYLKELNVTSDQLTNKAIEELAPLHSLTSLSIEGNAISVSGLKYLNNLKNLKILNIKKIKQDNSDIMDISGLTELEDMTLFLNVDFNYRDGSLANIARFRDKDWACLAKLTKLQRLQITGFGISDAGMKYLSDLKNLEFLSIQCLREESITDDGIKQLASLPNLYRLVIKDGHFTDKALEYLSGMPALNNLELTSDFAFSNKAIESFQTKNPNIEHLELIP